MEADMAKVNVRVAVIVARNGEWSAHGYDGAHDDTVMRVARRRIEDDVARYWLEAELDVPQETVVQAAVTRDGEP